MATATQKTDIELQMDIFKLEKSFSELVKDMFNKSFDQTIITRKSELYSDYNRTADGYLLLNNSSSIYRVELQKQTFTATVDNMITADTKQYVFDPFFKEFITSNNIPIKIENEQLKKNAEIIQDELISTQEQVKQLLQDINSTINDKENLQTNYDQIIKIMNEKYIDLQKQYDTLQKNNNQLLNENLRIRGLYMTASLNNNQA